MLNKEAIQYLQESGIDPNDRVVQTFDQDGRERFFIINNEGRAMEITPTNFRAGEPLVINTLKGLVDYLHADFERLENKFILQIEDEQTVSLKGQLESDGGRETLVRVDAVIPHFHFDNYYDTEELNIALQARFVQNNDRDVLLKVIGNIKEENVRGTGDDGVSQAVTIKTGISSVGDVKVPNPVTLAPYRTFVEVEQPESDFIFRMKDGPRAALFEADGGAWRNKAIKNVREHLEEHLQEYIEFGRITIIS